MNVMVRWKHKLFGITLIVLVALGVELVSRVFLPSYFKTARRILLGAEETPLVRVQNTIGQAYLLYICAPNYANPVTGRQHNEDGYRGKAVPLDRQPGVLRVLCLGGSTTYGWCVPYPRQAYPAVLEELLRANPPKGYTGVEVMNGGLPWGTSAEIFTHYHFKYHYYRPDVVIINEGGNDAQGYTLPFYHPDNSNWRQPLVNLRALPPHARWLAYSHFMSYLMLTVFYSDQLYGNQFYNKSGMPPPAPWFKPGGRLVEDPVEMPLDRLSFAHNMETLVREVQADGARVLLVPFRVAPGAYKTPDKAFELSQIIRHEQIYKDLAAKYQVGFAPFPAEVITPTNWVDHCHVNAAGEAQKAAYIEPYVRALLTASAMAASSATAASSAPAVSPAPLGK